MIERKSASVLLSALVVAALLGCASVPDDFDRARVERDAREAARREIASGSPTIWVIGRVMHGNDEETGLPLLGFTCMVSRESEIARDEHNDEILRALRAGEIRAPLPR